MIPIEPPEYEGTRRMVWKGPTPDIEDLVVRIAPDGMSYSLWRLSFNERRAVLDGANVILQVVGRHPPVSLSVEGVTE